MPRALAHVLCVDESDTVKSEGRHVLTYGASGTHMLIASLLLLHVVSRAPAPRRLLLPLVRRPLLALVQPHPRVQRPTSSCALCWCAEAPIELRRMRKPKHVAGGLWLDFPYKLNSLWVDCGHTNSTPLCTQYE